MAASPYYNIRNLVGAQAYPSTPVFRFGVVAGPRHSLDQLSAATCSVQEEWWRRRADSNRRMGVLQTPALPLGYVASKFDMEREMGLEPTAFSLARRRSTSELLPHDQTPMPIITEAQVVCTPVTTRL